MRLDELDDLAFTDEQAAEARRFRQVVVERIRINKERARSREKRRLLI